MIHDPIRGRLKNPDALEGSRDSGLLKPIPTLARLAAAVRRPYPPLESPDGAKLVFPRRLECTRVGEHGWAYRVGPMEGAGMDMYARDMLAGSRGSELEELHSHMAEPLSAPRPTSTIKSQVEHLDLATVIEVLQAISGETVLEQLIDALMRTAIEHAAADRGLLILPRGAEQRIAAEVTAGGTAAVVQMRDDGVSPAALPETVFNHVLRTQRSLMLDDARAPNPFSADPYVRQRRARSILCLPVSNRGKLAGILYLEHKLAPRVFTPARMAVLTLLASQAAVSLENIRLYQALKRSEAYLAESQRLTHTGSWAFSDARGRYTYYSDEQFRIYGLEPEPGHPPERDVIVSRFHPEDRERMLGVVDQMGHEKRAYTVDYRIVLPDGAVRHLHSTSHPVMDERGELLEQFGTVADVTERTRAEKRLIMETRVTRVLSEAFSLNEAMPKILQAICESQGWHLSALWQLDRQEMVLRCTALWYAPSVSAAEFEEVTRASVFTCGKTGLPGRVWERGETAHILDVTQDPEFPRAKAAAQAGFRGAIGF